MRHGHVSDLRILALHPRHESFPRHTTMRPSITNVKPKEKKKKREKELKKKRIKQRNNEFSFTPIYPYRGPIRTRNEKLIICKHVEETFEEKISKTDALPPLDGWPRRIEDEN